ncbi:MAG: ribulose-phosphate 3-epimerase [Clostridia bacterium]|nr:ribulose-phosphate 3-epimerase [Clostridia bacterium]
MKKMIFPSLMCMDFTKFSEQLSTFERHGIEYLHLDVMDGSFVPNFTLGTDFIKQVRKVTDIPLDIHLMINDPENKLDWFEFGEGDIVSIHVESTKHLQRALQKIKARGAKPYVAINPATPLVMIEDVLEDIDGILVMTVNPGFAGQKLVPQTLKKIARARALLDANGKADAEIEVDGNVSFINAKLMSEAGANIFVAGTSSVFVGNMDENIDKLRDVING